MNDTPDAPDLASSPVCVCPLPAPFFARPGVPVSFWEPARFIEVVKDAFCFPSIGTGLTPLKPGFQNGGSADGGTTQEGASTFYQAHYAIYPVWTIMEAFVDFVCLESSGFDMAYMTEVDPTWNDDLFAQLIYPETLLFGNMPAQLSCIADSVSSNAGLPLSAMYWCLGSEGSTYPMSGSINDDNLVQASLTAASRLMYKMGRLGSICDVGLHYCTCIPTPIWVKHNYRFNLAKPVTGFQCVPPGRSACYGVLPKTRHCRQPAMRRTITCTLCFVRGPAVRSDFHRLIMITAIGMMTTFLPVSLSVRAAIADDMKDLHDLMDTAQNQQIDITEITKNKTLKKSPEQDCENLPFPGVSKKTANAD
ncbi:MAG: TraU family protein [Desulfobacterales bacterium]